MALNLKTELKEARKVFLDLRNIGPDLKAELKEVVRLTTVEVHSEALRRLQQGGSGRTYGDHVASSPGQPPASQTGALARNLKQKVLNEMTGVVYSDVNAPPPGSSRGRNRRKAKNMRYAFMLESGTRFMRPRPFMVPARDARQAAFEDRINRILVQVSDQFGRGG